MVLEMHLGVNVHELLAANSVGPIYSEEYKVATSRRREILEIRQAGGEEIFGINLETTLLILAPAGYNIVLWTDRDLKHKLKLVQKAVKQTPLNRLLTDW